MAPFSYQLKGSHLQLMLILAIGDRIQHNPFDFAIVAYDSNNYFFRPLFLNRPFVD